MAVNPIQRVVDIEDDCAAGPRGSCRSRARPMASIMRESAVLPGRFSSRHIVGYEQSSAAALGASRPDRHLEGRIGAQGIAVVGVLVAGRDHQHAERRIISARPWLDAVGRARDRPRQAANRSAMARRFSISASTKMPASEVSPAARRNAKLDRFGP